MHTHRQLCCNLQWLSFCTIDECPLSLYLLGTSSNKFTLQLTVWAFFIHFLSMPTYPWTEAPRKKSTTATFDQLSPCTFISVLSSTHMKPWIKDTEIIQPKEDATTPCNCPRKQCSNKSTNRHSHDTSQYYKPSIATKSLLHGTQEPTTLLRVNSLPSSRRKWRLHGRAPKSRVPEGTQ